MRFPKTIADFAGAGQGPVILLDFRSPQRPRARRRRWWWLRTRLHDRGRPQTPLRAADAAEKKVYEDLADGFGTRTRTKPDWDGLERHMFATIDLERLLAVERATVEKGKP